MLHDCSQRYVPFEHLLQFTVCTYGLFWLAVFWYLITSSLWTYYIAWLVYFCHVPIFRFRTILNFSGFRFYKSYEMSQNCTLRSRSSLLSSWWNVKWKMKRQILGIYIKITKGMNYSYFWDFSDTVFKDTTNKLDNIYKIGNECLKT